MKARKAVLVLLVAAVIISCGTKPPLERVKC